MHAAAAHTAALALGACDLLGKQGRDRHTFGPEVRPACPSSSDVAFSGGHSPAVADGRCPAQEGGPVPGGHLTGVPTRLRDKSIQNQWNGQSQALPLVLLTKMLSSP